MRTLNKFCLVRSSIQLKQAIKLRLKTTTQKAVCEAVGVQPTRFNNYLNGETVAVSQAKLLKICRYLNIHVELKIELR